MTSNDLLKTFLDGAPFTMYFQPIVTDITGQHVMGYEALLRVPHPTEDGYIDPQILIQTALTKGLLVDLELIILGKVATILSQATSMAGSKIFVNVTMPMLQSPEFVHMLRQSPMLRRCVFEINEMVPFTLDVAMNALTPLVEMGCTFALDDFGAGHTKLFHAVHLPVDIIKLDRSLLGNNASRHFLTNLIELLLSIRDVRLVIEGVETEEHVRHLQGIGVAGRVAYQGYLFGRPAEVQEPEERQVAVA